MSSLIRASAPSLRLIVSNASLIHAPALQRPRSVHTTHRIGEGAANHSIKPSSLTKVNPDPVIALPASALSWPAFAEHYFNKRPVVLVGALDLARWSFNAWVTALTTRIANHPTSCDVGSAADLLLSGKTNTLSQRGNANVVAGIGAAQAAAHVFGPSHLHDCADSSSNNLDTSNDPNDPINGNSMNCSQNYASSDGNSGGSSNGSSDSNISAYWQWRTSLGTLGCGQLNGSSRIDDDPTGSTLPPCLPLPELLRTWPGVRVRPNGESAVFATSAGGRTALHQDGYHNCLLHLMGRKTVVLIAPECGDIHPDLFKALFTTPGTHSTLYGTEAASTALNAFDSDSGPIDVKDDDDSSLHGARVGYKEANVGVLGIPRQDVCLAPGDLLYIPEGWWHDVESTTATVSVALRFDVGATTPDTLFAGAFDL